MTVLQALDSAWERNCACRPKGHGEEVWFYAFLGTNKVVRSVSPTKNHGHRVEDGLPVRAALLEVEWETAPFPPGFTVGRQVSKTGVAVKLSDLLVSG